MSINEPHNSWLGMANDTTSESSNSAFLNDDRVRLAGEDGSLLRLVFLIRLFWHTVIHNIYLHALNIKQRTLSLHLPGGLHLSNALDTLHALRQL